MHIVNFDNFQINLTEEVAFIKPIRDIWNADKSRTKDKALQQLSVVYFMADPRSSYNYILDDKERLAEIIRQEGLPADYKLEGKVALAIEEYKKHTITASYELLQDTKLVIQNMRNVLKSIDWDSLEEKDKINASKTVASVASLIPKLAKDMQEAENAVSREIEEQGRARGGNEAKTIFEDGITL